MTENHYPHQELTAQLAEITETIQREKVELTPEVKKYFDKNLKKLTDKLAKKEPIFRKDLAFIEKIKRWVGMPAKLRIKLPSIGLMENPRLTKEQKEKLFETLKSRFKKKPTFHVGLEWSNVKKALKADEKAMWSINEMEEAGHEPDVYLWDEAGFDIGTCSKESPESGRNCVYDADAAQYVKEKFPDNPFNGSADEMAETMRIELMNPYQYVNLQYKGRFDTVSESLLKTHYDKRKSKNNAFSESGFVTCGRHRADTDNVSFEDISAELFDNNRGWRGTLRIPWKK